MQVKKAVEHLLLDVVVCNINKYEMAALLSLFEENQMEMLQKQRNSHFMKNPKWLPATP